MNELMVILEGGHWLYFRTSQTKADKAFQEFQEALNNAGINDDNVGYIKAGLRNSAGNYIESIRF